MQSPYFPDAPRIIMTRLMLRAGLAWRHVNEAGIISLSADNTKLCRHEWLLSKPCVTTREMVQSKQINFTMYISLLISAMYISLSISTMCTFCLAYAAHSHHGSSCCERMLEELFIEHNTSNSGFTATRTQRLSGL